MDALVTTLIVLVGLALVALLAVIVWPLTFGSPRTAERRSAAVHRLTPTQQASDRPKQRAA